MADQPTTIGEDLEQFETLLEEARARVVALVGEIGALATAAEIFGARIKTEHPHLADGVEEELNGIRLSLAKIRGSIQ